MSTQRLFERHAHLLERMANATGADLAEHSMRGTMTYEEYRDAIVRCIGCTEAGACADWVAAHPDGAPAAPDYCRNREELARLARI